MAKQLIEVESTLIRCPDCGGAGSQTFFEQKTLPGGQILRSGRAFSQTCWRCVGRGEVIRITERTVKVPVQQE